MAAALLGWYRQVASLLGIVLPDDLLLKLEKMPLVECIARKLY
jgi:hypothetical protein